MTQSYDDLIRRAQQASEEERRQILDQLVMQFAEAAYRWALLILQDENTAYDAVQDAWLTAYLHLDQLRESTAFPAWFRQIVVTSSHHTIRGQNRSVPLTEEQSGSADPTEAVEVRERQERVWEAVQALPEHERVVTEMFYFRELSQQEIAEVLAVPLTTIKKRLQYARQRLKLMIHPDIMAKLNGAEGTLSHDILQVPALEWTPFPASSMDDQPDLTALWQMMIPR